MNDYPVVIFWSSEDQAFIADVPDLRSCSAHGESPEEALRDVRIALEACLAMAREHGIPLPTPTLRPVLASA